jgi:hypothetical protein
LKAGNDATSSAAGFLMSDDRANGDAEIEKASRLLDALNEFSERRLDRPSTNSIGKLLRSRLVDRPTFLDDDSTILTLKAGSANNTNAYRVHDRRSRIM